MNITLFKRLAIPLLLLPLMALWIPGAGANSIEDGDGSLWRASSVQNGANMQVFIEVTLGAEPASSFWATSAPLNSIDPFLLTDGTQVWLVWSKERQGIDDTFDIWVNRIYADGTVDDPASQVTKANDPLINDRKSTAAIWERVFSSSDPNPWEKVTMQLPLNP